MIDLRGFFHSIFGGLTANRRAKKCMFVLEKLIRQMQKKDIVLSSRIHAMESEISDLLMARKDAEAVEKLMEVLECKKKRNFHSISYKYCRAIIERADGLFSHHTCLTILEEAVVNLCYASYMRTDLPLLRTFRRMIDRQLPASANGFLNLPLSNQPFNATTYRVTVQVYDALRVPTPNRAEIGLLFENICAKKGAFHWRGFQPLIAAEFRRITENLYE